MQSSYSPSKSFSLAQRALINPLVAHENVTFSVNSVNTGQLKTILSVFRVCQESTYHAFPV